MQTEIVAYPTHHPPLGSQSGPVGFLQVPVQFLGSQWAQLLVRRPQSHCRRMNLSLDDPEIHKISRGKTDNFDINTDKELAER